jgi:hypothetical protein
MNIQAKLDESKMNREFINANAANLPTLDEIGIVPCTSGMRDDKKKGVFSIQEMPGEGGKL